MLLDGLGGTHVGFYCFWVDPLLFWSESINVYVKVIIMLLYVWPIKEKLIICCYWWQLCVKLIKQVSPVQVLDQTLGKKEF